MRIKFTISLMLALIFCSSAALADTIYVPGDQPTIQAGIDAASEGDTVLVADGIFTGSRNKDLDFYGKAITVKSENGPEYTTIDCEGAGRGFYFHNGEESDSVVLGITIMNGRVNGSGGAILFERSSPTIENCKIINNITSDSGISIDNGGGLYLRLSSPAIINCIISNNVADDGGGGISMEYSLPTIKSCLISNNIAIWGGGIASRESSPIITDCLIKENQSVFNSAIHGGGISISGDYFAPIIIDKCEIILNSSTGWGGGIAIGGSSPTITNCIISDNTSYRGGGISIISDYRASDANISNCTITRNTALYGGGITCYNPSYFPTVYNVITNSIIWGNIATYGSQIALVALTDHPSSLFVNYSDVEGGEQAVYVESGCVLNWGDGNINNDPLFVGSDDYHLSAESPCIDFGTNIGAPNHDFDGDSRPHGAGHDMGADEYTGIVTGNYNLSNISTVSDEFQLWTDISINDQAPTDICQNYDFAVKTDDVVKTSQINCQYLENEPVQIPNSSRYRIWLKINPDPSNQRAAYFENGNIYMCRKNEPSVCARLKGIDNFFIYGTTFDIARHAWRFDNGVWYYPIGILHNFPHKSADAIANYFKPENRNDFWKWFDKKVWSGNGGCYGLTNSAIANFNHEGTGWGMGDIDNWADEIHAHWDYDNIRPYTPYKPFNTLEIHSDEETFSLLTRWTDQSCKKIMYYFAAQPDYRNMGNSPQSWIGKDRISPANDRVRPERVIPILRNGSPASLVLDLARHSVALTQLIRWNGHDKFIIWDNGYPFDEIPNKYGPYLEWYVENVNEYNGISRVFLIKFVKKIDGNGVFRIGLLPSLYKYGRKTNLPTYLPIDESDSQNIYNSWGGSVTNESLMVNNEGGSVNTLNSTIVEESLDHIEILVLGAHIDGVYEKNTGTPIVLVPNGEIIPSQAIIRKSLNGRFNFLYLPVDMIYKIEATKYSDYPKFKIFVSIPNIEGTVEKINYENIETGENDETNIYFFVGRENADKGVRRSILDDIYDPDYDDIIQGQISAPLNFQAIYESGTVNLAWNNVASPNLSAVRIIRKESGLPETPNDGLIVFEGFSETTIDNEISMGSSYFYAAYSIDSSANFSEPAYTRIDTGLYSVYGTVSLSTGEKINDAEITIMNSEGEIIELATTGLNGSYIFPNKDNGDFTLEASHASHEIQNPIRNLSINNQNIQENFLATPVPTLQLIFNLPEVKVSNLAFIEWAYRNLDNNSTIDINLDRGSGWESVASDIPILDGQYIWNIGGDAAENAILRISLHSDPLVYDEQVLNIKEASCICDFEPDGDVDGADLVFYLFNSTGISLADFATEFGKADCQGSGPQFHVSAISIVDCPSGYLGNTTSGWEFSTGADPMKVTALGLLDYRQLPDPPSMPPITNNHIVGIWDINGTLLSSAVVTPSSELSGSFRYTNISPIVLDAETTYVIGAENDTGDLFCRSTGYIAQPEIDYLAERRDLPTTLGLNYPDYVVTGQNPGLFGPNFKFEVIP